MFVPTRPLFYVTVTVPVYHHSTDGLIGSRTYRESAHLTLDEAYGAMMLAYNEADADGCADYDLWFGVSYKGKQFNLRDLPQVTATQGPYYCPWDGERTFEDPITSHYDTCNTPF